jgi:glutathione S-transferase
MLRLESAATCRRTPVILFALEELGERCEVVLRESGHFRSRYHTAGPLLVDDGLDLIGFDTILRHLARTRGGGTLLPSEPRELALVDRWMELVASLRSEIARIIASPSAPPPEAVDAARELLWALDESLGDRDYLLGRFSVADVQTVIFAELARLGFDLSGLPHLAAYVERVAARPTWRRVRERSVAFAGGAK